MAELLTNPNFDSNINGWTVINGTVAWISDGGAGAIDVTRTENNAVKQEVTITKAGVYMLKANGKHLANGGNGLVTLFNQALTIEYGTALGWSSTDTVYTLKSELITISTPGTYAVTIVMVNAGTARFAWDSISFGIPEKPGGSPMLFGGGVTIG